MKKIKIYVLIDKKTGELLSYDCGKELCFWKKKKNVEKECNAEISEAILEIKIKNLDY